MMKPGRVFLLTASLVANAEEVTYPPRFASGEEVITLTSPDFLKPPAEFPSDAAIAKTAPTVDTAYFPGQDYPGKPWSAWGDSLAANGKYYASVGDHLAPGGNAFVYEYDPAAKSFRRIADVVKTIGLPKGHYTPGKIHSRLDLGDDGWLYFSTHRGSTKVTTDEFHYEGDWILRTHPASGKTEIVARGPVPKHCIPCSVLDPKRLIFYGGTAPGVGNANEGVQFFAYDVAKRKVLYAGEDGPPRAMMFARSTGKIYYTAGKSEDGSLMRFDPERVGPPEKIPGQIGIRAATEETPDGFIYTVSSGQRGGRANLYRFNVRTEAVELMGPAAIGSQQYIASIDADRTGRFLYYIPGAHGGSEKDGAAVIQYDIAAKRAKVLTFLHPVFQQKLGCTLKGTYSSALDPAGDKLYITWNNSRGSKAWDSCVLTVVHIPESERQ